MASPDPRDTLLNAPMSRYQWTAVAITVALCALDGFDVLAVTLAAPGIVREWGVSRAALGAVFSAGLAGMALGSLIIAPIADRVGRRPLVMAGLVLMILGTGLSATAHDIGTLALWRIVTGLGIGATIAVINPLAAEYSSARRRDLAIGAMAVGFPIGGVLGGSVAAQLLLHHDWRTIFLFAATLGVVMIPVVAAWLPEPVAFLIERPRQGALHAVNCFLARCGHPPIAALPAPAPKRPGARLLEIFGPETLGATLGITSVYFLFVMTVYFFLNWIPQVVADLGFTAATAARVSVTANLSGVVGGLAVGAVSPRLGLKVLAILTLAGMGLATIAFGFAPANLLALEVIAGVAGLFLFGGMVSLYALVSRTFPTPVRATGSGFVIGIGRVGSALAPIVAGGLFAAGLGRPIVFVVMGATALVAAAILAYSNKG